MSSAAKSSGARMVNDSNRPCLSADKAVSSSRSPTVESAWRTLSRVGRLRDGNWTKYVSRQRYWLFSNNDMAEPSTKDPWLSAGDGVADCPDASYGASSSPSSGSTSPCQASIAASTASRSAWLAQTDSPCSSRIS